MSEAAPTPPRPAADPSRPDSGLGTEAEGAFLTRCEAKTRSFRDSFPFAPRAFAAPGPDGPTRAMHFVDEGSASPAAGPVLCVHGNPTWSFYWRSIVLALRDETRVVAPDHLGMGLSERVPGGMRLAEHVRALVALVDHLDLSDITLVVHDWGGAIGFGAALERPERFSRFVVTNTAAFPSGTMPRRIAACRVPLLGRLAVQGGNAFARAATTQTTAAPLARETRAALLAPYDSWAAREQIWRFVADIPMGTGHPSWQTLCGIADRLERLRGRPMEIVWGMRDWCFTPTYLAAWRERFPEAGVTELEGAGHYVNEDAPRAVIEAIRRVRQGVATAGGGNGA